MKNNTEQDFSNPEVAKHLNFYPEEVIDGPISEVWQAERWKEFKPSELTPMFSSGFRQYFIEEVTSTRDGRLVIPRNLILRKGILCADCSVVKRDLVRLTFVQYPYDELFPIAFHFNRQAG